MRYRVGALLGYCLKGAAFTTGVVAVLAPIVAVLTSRKGFARDA